VNSQLDDVNELLKLKQGDLVRLAHIKKTLESRNVCISQIQNIFEN